MDFVGWEKLSLVDFDTNLTTTLFMAGCPFRCPFCHNSALVLNPNDNPTIPWSEIHSYLAERRKVLDAVCITGGEPTLMPDLEDKIRDIRALGYLIKLDTNGIHPEVVKRLVNEKLIDYVAMDIKNSPKKYGETTGVPNVDLSKIKETVDFLMSSGIRYEFRTTIIDEYHMLEDIREIGEFIKGADKYFLQKYIDNGNCIKHGLHEVPLEKAVEFKEMISNCVKNVSLRGYDKN